MQKFRQISIVFAKPGILSENLKYLPMSTKGVFGIFLFCLDYELFKKMNDLVSTHSFFTFLLVTQVLNKIKKSHFCRYCLVGNMCKISGKNIKF